MSVPGKPVWPGVIDFSDLETAQKAVDMLRSRSIGSVLSEVVLADRGAVIAEHIETWLQADRAAVRQKGWWQHVLDVADGGRLTRPLDLDDEEWPQFMTSVMSHAIRRVWARGKIVHAVNPEMVTVLESSLSDRMPGSIFAKQPYTDPMVVFPEPLPVLTLDGAPGKLIGFNVVGCRSDGDRKVLCSTHEPHRTELWLNFFVERRVEYGLLDMQQTRVRIPVGQSMFTVDDAVESSLQDFLVGVSIPSDAPRIEDTLRGMMRTALSVLVYVCTKEPDVERVRGRGRPPQKGKRGKKDKDRQKQPRPLELYRLGYVLGPALGVVRREYEQSGPRGPGEGRRQPPHQRRAHMRLFHVGPGRTEEEIKFIAPYEVSLDLLGEAAAKPRVHVVAPSRRKRSGKGRR